ncbi:MAG: ParB N-terminal domain-containing protein [candidate division WOR-3 bacterium]
MQVDEFLAKAGREQLLKTFSKLREIYQGGARLEEVPIQKIRVFEDFRNLGALSDLAKSIHTVGQVNPVVLFKREDDYFLVLGLRRLNSVKREGKILALVYQVQEPEEEIRRLVVCARIADSLSIPFSDRTRGLYIKELESFGLRTEEISKILGIHPSTVSRLKKEVGLGGALSKLPRSLKDEILDKVGGLMAEKLAELALNYQLTKEQIRDGFRLAGGNENAYTFCFKAAKNRDLFPQSLKKKLEKCINDYLLKLASAYIGKQLDGNELKGLIDIFGKVADQMRLVVAAIQEIGPGTVTVEKIKSRLEELGLTPPSDTFIQELIRICSDSEGLLFLLGKN